jgi:hypothetical protein
MIKYHAHEFLFRRSIAYVASVESAISHMLTQEKAVSENDSQSMISSVVKRKKNMTTEIEN